MNLSPVERFREQLNNHPGARALRATLMVKVRPDGGGWEVVAFAPEGGLRADGMTIVRVVSTTFDPTEGRASIAAVVAALDEQFSVATGERGASTRDA